MRSSASTLPFPAMRKPSVLVIFLTVFIDLIGFGIVVPLVPVYSRHFGAHGFVIGVIIASFSAMQFLFAPVWGRLSDRHGRRPVLILGLLSSAVFYALFSYAIWLRSMALVCFARIGPAVPDARTPSALAASADSTPDAER